MARVTFSPWGEGGKEREKERAKERERERRGHTEEELKLQTGQRDGGSHFRLIPLIKSPLCRPGIYSEPPISTGSIDNSRDIRWTRGNSTRNSILSQSAKQRYG